MKDLIYRKKHFLFKLSNYIFTLTIMPHAKIGLFNFKHFNYHLKVYLCTFKKGGNALKLFLITWFVFKSVLIGFMLDWG